MFNLKHAKIYYGTRSIPMLNVVLPESIESAADIDLDDLAAQLNRFVFKKSWKLEISGTSEEKAAEMNEMLAEDPQFDHLPRFKPTIYIAASGVGILYEKGE